jgi:Bacterial membrane protein YfhO
VTKRRGNPKRRPVRPDSAGSAAAHATGRPGGKGGLGGSGGSVDPGSPGGSGNSGGRRSPGGPGTETPGGPGGDGGPRHRAAAALASAGALIGLLALAYHRVLFLGQTFVERDALRFALPSREFLAHALRAGRLPEWLDAVGLGAPFAANPVHETLAPLGWALALVPGALGSDLYNLLHLLIGALGAAAFARRLGAGTAGSVVAGAALALGGYVTSMVPNNLAPALAWTPWVAWAADRLGCAYAADGRSSAQPARPAGPPAGPPAGSIAGSIAGRASRAVAALAVALALQLLAGEPGSVLIAGLTALIVVMARAGRQPRALAALAAAAAAALPLAAVAMLPALLLLRESARGAGLDQGGLEWSLLPARLIETIWPAAFGSQRVDGWLAGLVLRDGPGDPCWSFSLFLGLPVLICAWTAARQRVVRRLLLASAVFLLLAVGPLLPVLPFLREILTPLRWVNFPEKFVYGTLLLWSAAAGAGFSRLAAEGASRRLRLAAWAGTALLALGVAWLALSRTDAAATLARRAAAWGVLVNTDAGLGAALRGGGVAAGAAGLFALALAVLARRRPDNGGGGAIVGARGAMGLALLAILGPLVWTAATTTPLAHRSVIAATPVVLRGIAPSSAPGPGSVAPRPRLFRLEPRRENGPFHGGDEIARDYHESLDTNIASRFGFDVLPGFEPGESTRFLRFGREVFPHLSATAFTRLLGVDWLVVRDPETLGLPFPVVATGEGGSALLAAGAVRPRAFVTPRWRAAATPGQALEALADTGREDDPALITLVNPDPEKTPAPQGPLSPCRARQPRPEQVLLDCDSPTGGYAVLLDEWAPGWTAATDGHPAPILLADGLFRAVPVEPGPHQVVLSYRTPGLRTGAAISLLAWLAGAAWLLLARRRSPT